MRQRQALERAIAGYKKLERELDDAIDPDRARRIGGRRGLRRGRRGGSGSSPRRRGARRWRRCSPARPTATTPTSRCTPAPAAPRARTGPRCSRACTLRWAENHDYKVSLIEQSAGEEAGIKSATLQIKGENAYGWLKTGIGRAPPGAHLALRQQRAPAHLASPACGSFPWSTRTSRSTSRRATAASTPIAPRAPAASTSTPPTRRCASRTCPPTSPWRASRSARRSRTAPSPGPC